MDHKRRRCRVTLVNVQTPWILSQTDECIIRSSPIRPEEVSEVMLMAPTISEEQRKVMSASHCVVQNEQLTSH